MGQTKPLKEREIDVLMERIKETVEEVLRHLRRMERVERKIEGGEYRIVGYYNWPSHIRLEINRIDKQRFFGDHVEDG